MSSFISQLNCRDVYSICVAFPDPLADRLYVETKSFLENYVKSQLEEFHYYMNEINDGENSNQLLNKYYCSWQNYSKGLQYLNYLYQYVAILCPFFVCLHFHEFRIVMMISLPIFRYLNTQHIRKQKVSEAEVLYGNGTTPLSISQEQMEIGELGLDIWRQLMIENLGDILVKQILYGIERDRNSNSLASRDIETIHGVIHSFVTVQDTRKRGVTNLYENLFECKLLEASGVYFMTQASKLLQNSSVSQYMKEVIRILEEENIRAHKFIHVSSVQKLKKECEDRMILDHKAFLYSECKEMVSTDKREDLRNLYTLLKPIHEGLKELIQILLDQIKNEGAESIMNLKGENVRC